MCFDVIITIITFVSKSYFWTMSILIVSTGLMRNRSEKKELILHCYCAVNILNRCHCFTIELERVYFVTEMQDYKSFYAHK